MIREIEEKVQAKARREALAGVRERPGESFTDGARRLLPLALREMERALNDPDEETNIKIRIAESLADRVLGKAAQVVTGAGGGPLEISFTQILVSIDGSRREEFPEPKQVHELAPAPTDSTKV